MARFRHIPTPIKSLGGLVKALEELGLRDVEVHERAEPLIDWIGRPTDELAQVIVRRRSLGAAGDDVGFARNPDGTFDFLVSDIHLFRFGKGWLEELVKRHDALADAPDPERRPATASPVQPAVPAAGSRPLITPRPTASVARTEVGRPWSPAGAPSEAAKPRAFETKHTPASESRTATRPDPVKPSPPGFDPGRDDRALERVERDALAILREFEKGQALSSRGCLFFLLPVPIYLVFMVLTRGSIRLDTVLGLTFVCGFLSIAVTTSSLKRGIEKAARDFAVRFPKGTRERTAALAAIEALAKSSRKGSTPNALAAKLLAAVR